MLWEHQVAGSNPACPTNDQHCARHSLDVCKRARFDNMVDLSISAVDVSKLRPTSLPVTARFDLGSERKTRGRSGKKLGSGTLIRWNSSAGRAGLSARLV